MSATAEPNYRQRLHTNDSNYSASSTGLKWKLLSTHFVKSFSPAGPGEGGNAAGPPLQAWVVLTLGSCPTRISLSLSSGLSFVEGWWLSNPKDSTTERIQTSPWEELPGSPGEKRVKAEVLIWRLRFGDGSLLPRALGFGQRLQKLRAALEVPAFGTKHRGLANIWSGQQQSGWDSRPGFQC